MKYFKEKGKRYMALLMVCVMMVGLFPIGAYAEASPGTPVENLVAGNYINFGGQVWRLADPDARYLVLIDNLPTSLNWSQTGSNSDASKVFDYLNTEFSNIITVEASRDMIEDKEWDIRGVAWDDRNLTNPPLTTMVADGISISPLSFNGKLGILSIGEWNTYKGVIGTPASASWTRSPGFGSTSNIFVSGNIVGSYSVSFFYKLRPALYLRSGIIVAGGSGTQETPYTLEQYDATQDNADIGAAKDNIEDAMYTATQVEAETAEVAETKAQALVNALELAGTTAAVVPGSFTAAVAGTWGTPAGTNGSYTFTVSINKGGGTEQTSAQQTMTITATAYDPAVDNTAIGTAKGTIEGASYTATQAEAGTAGAAETKAQALVNALELEGTTAEVVPGSFTAAVAGTSGTPAGTNGAYTFTVTINKGGGTQQISAQKNMTITATPFAGLSDVDAVAAAKIAIETALSNLTVSNATTAGDILTAATNASLYGVSVAWDGTNGFSKTNATSSVAGSIIGTFNLTLNSASGTVAVNKSIAALPSTGGGGGGGGSTPQKPGNTIVTVNGEPESAGTETRTNEAGKSTVNVKLDNQLIESKIDAAIKTNTTGTGNVIQVPVVDTKSEVAKVELTGDIVKKLEENAFDVSVKRDTVEYIIPAEEFTISKVAENLGLKEKDLADIKVEVKITRLDEKAVERYNEAAKANGAVLVFPPVSFEVVAKTTKTDGSTGEVKIKSFSKYVERVLEIPAGVAPGSITTGIVFNADGTYSHVPTVVFQKDGKWYARINSLTNSNYSVINNSLTVKSVENHWSKKVVNDMASRLVIFNSEVFAPDKAITRADFAEYMVRALGLYRGGSTYENGFKDVSPEGARTRAILIANANGIVSGYPDGTFRPEGLITREEAMAMYQRAMKITKLVGTAPTRYQTFTDYDQVGAWATNSVKEALSAHIVNGTTATTLSPKANLTYAEAVQAIKNLLVESKLINK